MAGSINISLSTLTVLVMAVTLYQSLFIDAFIQHQHTTTLQIKRRYLASSIDDIDIPLDTTTTTTLTSTPSNPFLPLLSKGLHQTSIAMNKDTSNNQVFSKSSSLQRLRKQVITNTKVGPSSLGSHAGLGLFATKNIKAGTIVGLYPAHALGYELVVPIDNNKSDDDDDAINNEENLQDLSMFMSGNEQDENYFAEHPHGNSPYLHATDQPLFQRPSLLSPLFNEDSKDEISPPLYLDVNPTRNDELDPIWTSHYINDGASLLDTIQQKDTSIEDGIEEYYKHSSSKKNCIHIPFGPSPLLATITTKKVKKGQELFTSYGVVYWLGSVDMEGYSSTSTTETIQNQIFQSARDLQAAMEAAKNGYSNESSDLIAAFDDL